MSNYHGGIVWRYEDARGVGHVGHFARCSDFGGTDVSYHFRDCETGELSVVSGERLKRAAPAGELCAERTRLLAS